jgi:hypothetical protein
LKGRYPERQRAERRGDASQWNSGMHTPSPSLRIERYKR